MGNQRQATAGESRKEPEPSKSFVIGQIALHVQPVLHLRCRQRNKKTPVLFGGDNGMLHLLRLQFMQARPRPFDTRKAIGFSYYISRHAGWRAELKDFLSRDFDFENAENPKQPEVGSQIIITVFCREVYCQSFDLLPPERKRIARRSLR